MTNAMVLHGLHMPVQGHTPRAQAAANFLRGCYVWLNAENAADAASYPTSVHFVRLSTPLPGEQPRAYVLRVADKVRDWLQSPIWRNTSAPMSPPYPVFQVGNEPEQQAGGDVDTPWDIDTWLASAGVYAQAMRQQWPGLVLAAAPLRVENTYRVTEAYYEQYDIKTAHAYWQVRDDITNPNLGGAWQHAAGVAVDKPLFVTEVNSVAMTEGTDPTGNHYERGTRPDEVAEWAHTLDERVAGYMVYLADGEGATNTREKQSDVSPDDARVIMLGAAAPLPPAPPEPPPPPQPVPPLVIPYDGDYRKFWPYSLTQYLSSVDDYDAGQLSPLMNETAYHDLITVCIDDPPVDPRLPVAFMAAEGNEGVFGPAVMVHNYGGIKWAEQPWATDSGIPADTGGTYAAFSNLANYLREWKRTMHNEYIGPAFERGDLTGAVETYTNGPGSGHNKIVIYNDLTTRYPPEAIDPHAQAPIITRLDFLAEVRTQLGHIRSGTYDTRNGDHYWCNPATGDYFCESLMERAGEHLGVTVTPYATALAAGLAMQAAGRLNLTAPPPVGSIIVLGAAFWPDGHTGVCDTEGGTGMTCTATPEGIAHRDWGMQTPGYMGWYDYEGVGERKDVADMRVDNHRNDGGTFERQWYGDNWAYSENRPTAKAAEAWPYNPDFGIPSLWRAEFLKGRPLGAAISGEESTEQDGVVIQYFALGHIVWDNNTATGWVN